MLRIVNVNTREVIADGFGTSMTLDEAINMVGYIINDADSPEWREDNVNIDGKWYYYDDLDIESY